VVNLQDFILKDKKGRRGGNKDKGEDIYIYIYIYINKEENPFTKEMYKAYVDANVST
jgi:hypothetical protein